MAANTGEDHIDDPHQGTNFQFTVVQKPNQGTIRQRGCNPLSGSFFVSFLEKQKRKIKKAAKEKEYAPNSAATFCGREKLFYSKK